MHLSPILTWLIFSLPIGGSDRRENSLRDGPQNKMVPKKKKKKKKKKKRKKKKRKFGTIPTVRFTRTQPGEKQ